LEIENIELLITKGDLEKYSDSELVQIAIDSGNSDKIEFNNELENREELIEALVELTKGKVFTSSEINKISDAGLAKFELSDVVDETQITTVNYGRNIIGTDNTNHLSFAISSEEEQVVNDGAPEYEKKLETSIFSRSVTDDSKLDLSFISTHFNHKTTGKETGTRNHGEVNFNKLLGPLWPIDISRLSTDTKLSLSHYALDNNANETRVIGGFDVDLSFPFKSETMLFGSEANHKLIPMISYDYTSKKKQASIPIFDTTDTIDGYLDCICSIKYWN
jgi:hypothetical protein